MAGIAGLVTQGSTILRAATAARRTLVCIRLADTSDALGMVGSGGAFLPLVSHQSQVGFGLHRSLAALGTLFDVGSLAVIQGASTRHGGFEYLPKGFAIPAWLASEAGVSILSSQGKAFTLRTGTVMLTPDGSSLSGDQFENAALVSSAQQRSFAMPATSLGKQLQQVANLVGQFGTGRKFFVVSHGGAQTVGGPDVQLAARYEVLAEAMSAFQNALMEAGREADVVTFTDSVAPNGASGARLVMGRPVIGGELYTEPDAGDAALAEWAGRPSNGASLVSPRFLV